MELFCCYSAYLQLTSQPKASTALKEDTIVLLFPINHI